MKRGKRALKNSLIILLYQVITMACGFVLPKLILSQWGSNYNGLVSSITQFLSCIALLKSGITGVSQASLYKPLAENDTEKISGIIKATENFMRKISGVFCILLVFFSAVYPLFVRDDGFGYFFTFTLVLILGISTIFQYYFGITNQILLAADQKLYVYYVLQTISVIANTVVAATLINLGCGIRIVKLASALVFAVTPIMMHLYVRTRYKLIKDAPPDNTAINQRWDAFAHSVSEFIHSNTDVIVLTAFTNMKLVSVYSVYLLVLRGVKMIEMTFISGVEAAFGNMIAKKETDLLKQNFVGYETMIFLTSTVLYTCTAILMPSFISIYTKGIHDINYIRPSFACIICAAELLYCLRFPYNIVVHASGYFKETKKYAIGEAALNIIISVALVPFLGLSGIAIGTLVAMAFRTVAYVHFTNINIIKGVGKGFYLKLIAFGGISFVSFIISNMIPLPRCNTYFDWILLAVAVFLSVVLLSVCVSFIFFRSTFKYTAKKILHILKK